MPLVPNPYAPPEPEEDIVRAELAESDEDPTLKYVHRAILGVTLTVGSIMALDGVAKNDYARVGLLDIGLTGIALSAKQVDYRDALRSIQG